MHILLSIDTFWWTRKCWRCQNPCLKALGSQQTKWHWLHWFDFSPLCIIKSNLKLFEWTEENSIVHFQVVPKVACSKGCMITLAASIDLSPLWDLKCILKSAGQVDAKLHWLHLFDFSPLCVFKYILKLPAWEEAKLVLNLIVRFPNPTLS